MAIDPSRLSDSWVRSSTSVRREVYTYRCTFRKRRLSHMGSGWLSKDVNRE
jgi:hypothetical protein